MRFKEAFAERLSEEGEEPRSAQETTMRIDELSFGRVGFSFSVRGSL